VYPTARFIQAVLAFEGQGLQRAIPLGKEASYVAPADKRAQLIYLRAGQSLDELIYLSLLRDGRMVRLFPIGAKSSMHVPLAVVEDVQPGSRLDVHIGAPEGTRGTLVLDIGIVEID
jgi:hypothetical protein